MRKVTSRVITATQDVPTGPGGTVPTPATLTRSMKAPNLIVDVYKAATLSIANGFDGTAAWARAQNGNVTSPPAGSLDAERAQRAAAFYEPLTLKDQYRALTVDGMATGDPRPLSRYRDRHSGERHAGDAVSSTPKPVCSCGSLRT